MDVNKFTQKSQEAITNAQNTAVRFGHPEIGRASCRERVSECV